LKLDEPTNPIFTIWLNWTMSASIVTTTRKPSLANQTFKHIFDFVNSIVRVACMRRPVTHRIPIMFRAEYAAGIEPDLSNGCRQCMRVCQFGAISYSASNKKAVIEKSQCYGYGICRSVCRKDAIHIEQREKVSVVANLW